MKRYSSWVMVLPAIALVLAVLACGLSGAAATAIPQTPVALLDVSSGAAYFGHVALTPVEVYNTQPLHLNVAVTGIGEEAYFNNGADARQLWVKMNDQVAFVVAFGDQPREEGAKALARLVVAALK